MEAGELVIGSPVVICAAGEFYAYVDGWRGRVIGFSGGYVNVFCRNPDGVFVELLVPPAELKKDK